MGGLIEMSSVLRHMAALAGNQDLDMKRITRQLDLSRQSDRVSLSLSLSLSHSTFVRNARLKKLV